MIITCAAVALPALAYVIAGSRQDAQENNCPEHQPYWDPDERRCYVKCPREKPTKPDQRVCQTCAELNESAPYWDPHTAECVSACRGFATGWLCYSCFEVNPTWPYWDMQQMVCLQCPENSKYWDPNVDKCVDTCPLGVENEDERVCKRCDATSSNPLYDADKKTCVPCPAWLPNWNNTLGKCDVACPAEKPLFVQGMCVSCAEVDPDKPFLLGGECAAKCDSKFPLHDGNNACLACADLDPSTPLWDGSKCVACPEDARMWDSVKGECVKTCLESALVEDLTGICRPCQELVPASPRWDGTNCQPCDDDTYWTGSECASDCPAGSYKSILEHACVKSCGIFQRLQDDSCVCADNLQWNGSMCAPPSDDMWAKHTAPCTGALMSVSMDGSSCVARCGENEKTVDGRCACKENAVLDWTGKRCVLRHECARIFISDSGAEVCANSQTCGKDYALGPDGKHCVQSCDYYRQLDEATGEWRCIETCPEAITYSDDHAICSMCADSVFPSYPVWDADKQECVECPEETPNWDVAARQCVKPCPIDRPTWNGYECVTCADMQPSSALHFWDPMYEACVFECPAERPAFAGTQTCRTCADIYGDKKLLWDIDTHECTEKCKSIKAKVCLSCDVFSDWKPLWDDD